jgi:DNA-directed RNA polymerase specialized sigma24 family protein
MPAKLRRFAKTRWSLVTAAGGSSGDADAALAELCETYWYPVYAFVRRSGHPADTAEDLTQAFFVRVLELAETLQVSEGSLRVAVHRLRRDFGAMLRTIVAETVARKEDVDDELRYLLKAIQRGR